MPRIVVIDAPQPIMTAAEARAGLPALGELSDEVIDVLVAAATEELDGPTGWLGRAIGMQLIELQMPAFPACGAISLPLPPIVEVESIGYRDSTGAAVELHPSDYWVSASRVCPAAHWPSGRDVRVRYRAGYEDIPSRIKVAVQLRVGEMATQLGRDATLKKEVVEGVGSFEFDVGGNDKPSATSRAVETLLGGLRVMTI